MINKKIVSLFILTVITCCSNNKLLARQAPFDTIRIACIGNSITYGARLANPAEDSYPAVLQHLFDGNNITVKNFGISGATMIKFGQPNVWKQLDKIKLYLPNVVIIMIGTNETVSGDRKNWEHISDFENDYYDFLSQLKSLASHPIVYVCSPTDMVLATPGLSESRLQDLSLRRTRLWKLRKKVSSIARVSGVHFIDLTPKFKGKPQLITPGDGVHPNKAGYHFLAKIIFKKIKHTVNQLTK